MILALTSNAVVPAQAEENKFSCTGGTYSIDSSSGKLSNVYGCTGSLIIDSSAKAIGYQAFMSSELTSIVIPNSVTSIAGYSFAFTKKLKSIVIPESVMSIGPNAFYGTGLTAIEIPGPIQIIESLSFAYSNLSSISIPRSVKTIGMAAFAGNPNLMRIDIPDSVVNIGSDFVDKEIKSIIYCGSAFYNFPVTPTCPPERKAIIDAAAAEVAKAAAEKAAAEKAAFDIWYAAQQKAAADKAAAEKAQLDAYVAALDKEAADKAAADAAEAEKYAEKITITCKKGSVTKKVSAVTPKCPKGYTKVVPPKPRATCTKSEISTFNDVDMAMSSLVFSFYDAGDVFPYIDKAKKATKNKTLLALYSKLEAAIEAGGKGRSGKSKEAWYALKSKFEYNRCYSI